MERLRSETEDLDQVMPWGEQTSPRVLFAVLVSVATVLVASGVVASVAATETGTFRKDFVDPALDNLNKVLTIIFILTCFVAPIVLIIVAILLYYLGKWLSSQEKKCKGKKKKWWQRLLCWLVTIFKWVSWILAIMALLYAIYLIIICIVNTIAPGAIPP